MNSSGQGDLIYKWYCTKGTDILDKDQSKYQGFCIVLCTAFILLQTVLHMSEFYKAYLYILVFLFIALEQDYFFRKHRLSIPLIVLNVAILVQIFDFDDTQTRVY